MLPNQFYIVANILIVLDAFICIGGGYAAYLISIEVEKNVLIMARDHILSLVLFLMFTNNFIMGRFGFYAAKRFPSFIKMVYELFIVCALDVVVLVTGALLTNITPFSRVFAVAYFLSIAILFILLRGIFYFYLDKRTKTAFNSRQILLVGSEERLELVADALNMQLSWGHRIIGRLRINEDADPHESKIPILGHLRNFKEVLVQHGIDEVVFAFDKGFPLDLESNLRKCEEMGVSFRIVPSLFDISSPRLRVETIQGIPTLTSYSVSIDASGLLWKRILDLFAGMVGFLAFLMLYPIMAVVIKLDSPGPVLFKQKRVGQSGRTFYLYKYRSMNKNADACKKELLSKSEMSGPIFKIERDPRITKVGRFLRKTSLDEFPQFINVLKGEMSLVGTRPPTPDEVAEYEDWHRRRISLKPGITGLWQISGRNAITDFNEVVRLDLRYIDKWRFSNDLIILWKTIWVVLARKGAK
jgi:exopolysaccharide biosynthesis polyprenyl glycosylphosphotransferase